VALRDIRLQVGDVNNTITVEALTAHVATDEAQIENTPIRGRDWLGIMQYLPGVFDLNTHDAPGWNSGMPTVNGE